MSFRFWQRWLQAVGIASAASGALFLVAPESSWLAPYHRQVIEAFHGADASVAAVEQQRWATAILGSAMLGWAIMLTWIATVPFGRRERWAWSCIAVSVVAWAAGDSLVSYRAGVELEVLWNAVVVALVALPLLMTYRSAVGRSQGVDRSALHGSAPITDREAR